jgi:hypothetical protein
MAQTLSEMLRDFKELVAFFHWLSNLTALLTAISEHGITGGVIVWLISGFVLAILSEIIETRIPSYLRPILKIVSG